MASIFDSFPSKYLKASDLQGQAVRAIMAKVDHEDVGDDRKPVLYFGRAQNEAVKSKGLVLNVTNASTIAETYGEDPHAWEGKEISLYPTKTDFQGRRVDAIRIQCPQSQRQRSQPVAAPAPAHDERNPPPQDMNDEIPW